MPKNSKRNNFPKNPYTKHPLTFENQLQQLKDRGLVIEDDKKCLFLLESISYYRLSGYWYPMLEFPKEKHRFNSQSSFEKSFAIYCFDGELRHLISSELEKIEIAIRAKMIYTLAHKYGSFWFSDSTLFSNIIDFSNTITKLHREYTQSKEDFIKAFKEKYTDLLPPCWMMFEISSFGNLSSLYKNLRPCIEKREISEHFGLDHTTFESWIHNIVYIRNICAHHSRLWNRDIRIIPALPKKPRFSWIQNTIKAKYTNSESMHINDKVYCTLSIIIYFLNTINPNHSFRNKVFSLLEKYPNIDTTSMGFTINWKDEDLWQISSSLTRTV